MKYLSNVVLVVGLDRHRQLSDAPTQVPVQLDRRLNVVKLLHSKHSSTAHTSSILVQAQPATTDCNSLTCSKE